MAFGIKKNETPVREPNEDSVIGEYPGFTPPRYFRPTAPVIEKLDDPSQVRNNVDRGTESHGLYIDSKVHPQDAVTEEHSEDSSPVAEIYPEEPDDNPIPVRIVDDAGRHRTFIHVETYTVTGTTPVRIVSQDSERVQVQIGTVGTVTGDARLMVDANSLPVYGWPLPAASTAPLVLGVDQELWASGITSTDSFTVAVLSERRVPLDLPDSATRK